MPIDYSAVISVYKIQNKDTGLLSTGGINIEWSKKGKTWNSTGGVKNHLIQLKKYRDLSIYDNAVIVHYDLHRYNNYKIGDFV